MLFRQFTRSQREALNHLLEQREKVAVFDADGTLWPNDSSECFMQWLEEQDHIKPPVGYSSVMSYYEELLEQDRVASFIWSAQQAVGIDVQQLEIWCAASFDTYVKPGVFPEMFELIAELHQRDWQCWIVSASPRWVIEPAATYFGIPHERVLALELAIEDGVVMEHVVPPVTSGVGKVERVRKDITVRPSFAAGNSVDDVPLLEEASVMAMVINPTGLHNPELDLAEFGRARGWLVHYPMK